MKQNKQDMKKYNNASEDPLYWKLTIGLLFFSMFMGYFVGAWFSVALLTSLVGTILYILIFKEKRLKLKERTNE